MLGIPRVYRFYEEMLANKEVHAIHTSVPSQTSHGTAKIGPR